MIAETSAKWRWETLGLLQRVLRLGTCQSTVSPDQSRGGTELRSSRSPHPILTVGRSSHREGVSEGEKPGRHRLDQLIGHLEKSLGQSMTAYTASACVRSSVRDLGLADKIERARFSDGGIVVG